MFRRASLLALACAFPSVAATADDGLGRLFTSPEERVALEAARGSRKEATPNTRSSGAPSIAFEGVILRHGAPLVAWVNGVQATPAQWCAQSGAAASVQPEGLWLRHSRRRLKAGQTGVAGEP